MIKKRINKLRSKFVKYGIDGYVVPKNDEFFSEYSNKDRLKFISNFTGSAGYAVILKNRNYLFVDGRYTIQSRIESGKDFKIIDTLNSQNNFLWIGKGSITYDSNALYQWLIFKDIDFVNLDVEGHELEVLKTVDFKKIKIKYICIEMIKYNDLSIDNSNQILKLLETNNFDQIKKFNFNYIFKNKEL